MYLKYILPHSSRISQKCFCVVRGNSKTHCQDVFKDSRVCEDWPWKSILSCLEIKQACWWMTIWIGCGTIQVKTKPALSSPNNFCPSSSIALRISSEIQLEVLHSCSMCRVRESSESEAKGFTSKRLQRPESSDWHFPEALSWGGICGGALPAGLQSFAAVEPRRTLLWVFQTPYGDRDTEQKSLNKSYWYIHWVGLTRPHLTHNTL